MMGNERITEDIVRSHFKSDPLFSQILFEEQKSKIPKIDKLLQNASKKGTGKGFPEFIITDLPKAKDLLIVIECKADIQKHESNNQDKYEKYAVDGVLLYADYLSENYDVLAIAISGENVDNLKISHFLKEKGKEKRIIFGNELLSIEDYVGGYSQDEVKKNEKYEQLLSYSQELNSELHSLKIKEDKRSLLLSGILIALESEPFYNSYQNYSDKELAKLLVSTISEQF